MQTQEEFNNNNDDGKPTVNEIQEEQTINKIQTQEEFNNNVEPTMNEILIQTLEEFNNDDKEPIINEIQTQVKSNINIDNIDNVKIKYDNKELTRNEMQDIVEKWYRSLTEDRNENYVKLNNFLEKLDEGAFIWRYSILNNLKYGGNEYFCFEGYHSNMRNSNYIIYKKENNPNMKFHGCKCLYHDNKISFHVNQYCNYTFYYIPKSDLKLVSDIHKIMLDYFKYENLVESLNDQVKKCVQTPGLYDGINENIIFLISKYFTENIQLDSIIQFNSRYF